LLLIIDVPEEQMWQIFGIPILVFGYSGEVELLYQGSMWGDGGQVQSFELATVSDGRSHFVDSFSDVIYSDRHGIDRIYFALQNGEWVQLFATHTIYRWAEDEHGNWLSIPEEFYVNDDSVSEEEFNAFLAEHGITEIRDLWDATNDVRALLAEIETQLLK
jgi:hypothetical protein